MIIWQQKVAQDLLWCREFFERQTVYEITHLSAVVGARMC